MRDTPLLISNAQSRTNPNSTGTISTDVLDMEQTSGAVVILTDDQIEGYMNVILTSVTYTSGGTEGISLQVRNGDNSDLATGVEIIGHLDVPLATVIEGAKFSVPFKRQVAERYLGGWAMAKSTTYTGIIVMDAEFSDKQISENESLQKSTT